MCDGGAVVVADGPIYLTQDHVGEVDADGLGSGALAQPLPEDFAGRRSLIRIEEQRRQVECGVARAGGLPVYDAADALALDQNVGGVEVNVDDVVGCAGVARLALTMDWMVASSSAVVGE